MSKIDQLSKLAGLKSQGVLTDAEFEAQKAKQSGRREWFDEDG